MCPSRGRISTTELARITNVSTSHAGRTLNELEELGSPPQPDTKNDPTTDAP